ncbi:nonpolar-amino-acid-transporting ATPase [Pararobbsia alpina]|uniref:sugar ABC transporter ATP-binding protein n=1 Tax=Pararobbsia alpina TaxID=621374 RepID=UPI0039A739E3
MNAPHPPPPPRLALAGVSKRFGSTVALDHVDLSVNAGSIVALMGANGAGKSTLVKILAGVYPSDAGRIALDGQSVTPTSPQHAKALGIVTVHQAIVDTGVPTLSVAENLLLDRYCTRGTPTVRARRSDVQDAGTLAARVGLTVDLQTRLGRLTIADQQRVAIARALASDPSVVIFDEPTASLSDREAQQLFELIERLRDDGTAVLYISHRMADLERLADRAVVLRDGRVAGSYARGADGTIDFRGAVRTMIGRDLDPGGTRAPSGQGQAVLELEGVQLKPGREPFDLTFSTHEVVAITGPVGAGKTTLAEAIFGLRPLPAGVMKLDGHAWSPRSPAHSIGAGVFFAGEDRWRTSLFPSNVPFASIAGTISFPFLPRWFPFGRVQARRERDVASAAIQRFGIKCRGADDRLDTLSGGNQQKAVVARWHAAPARVLLLDEPFQGVDIGARDDLIRAIRDEAHSRATIVFVSDYGEALEVADRIVVLDHHALDATSSFAHL